MCLEQPHAQYSLLDDHSYECYIRAFFTAAAPPAHRPVPGRACSVPCSGQSVWRQQSTVQQLHRKLAPRPCHRCVLQYCFNSSIARAQSRCTKQCTYATSTGLWASSPFFRRPPISMAAHKRAHIKLETKFWQAHTRPTPRCGTSGSDCLGATDVIDNDAHGSRTHSSTA